MAFVGFREALGPGAAPCGEFLDKFAWLWGSLGRPCIPVEALGGPWECLVARGGHLRGKLGRLLLDMHAPLVSRTLKASVAYAHSALCDRCSFCFVVFVVGRCRNDGTFCVVDFCNWKCSLDNLCFFVWLWRPFGVALWTFGVLGGRGGAWGFLDRRGVVLRGTLGVIGVLCVDHRALSGS